MTQTARKQWFIYAKGRQEGPFTEDDIRGKLGRNEINGGVHAWCEGMDGWKFLRDIDTFKSAAAGPAPGGANPTIVSRSPSNDELSALIAVRPDAVDRTGAMDVDNLQRAELEAAKAVRLARETEKKLSPKARAADPLEEGGGMGKWIGLVGVLVVVGGVGYGVMNGKIPLGPLQGVLGGLISPIGKLEDVPAEDFENLKRAAASSLDKGGLALAVAMSNGNLSAPTFYIASNLPDGTKFNVLFKAVDATIVGKVPGQFDMPATVANHMARSGPVKLKDGSGVPSGDFAIAIIDTDDEPAPAAAAIKSFSGVKGRTGGIEIPKGRKVLATGTFFMGGKKDDDYKTQLRVFHDRAVKDAVDAVKNFQEFATAVESQLTTFDQGIQGISKTANKAARDKMLAQTVDAWKGAAGKLDDSLKKLASYKKLSTPAQGALAALQAYGDAEAASLKSGKKAGDPAVKGSREKVDQAVKELKTRIDEANQQAKTPWSGAPLLEKD